MKVIAAHSPAFSNAQQTAINLMVVFEGVWVMHLMTDLRYSSVFLNTRN